MILLTCVDKVVVNLIRKSPNLFKRRSSILVPIFGLIEQVREVTRRCLKSPLRTKSFSCQTHLMILGHNL